jgi:CHAT domain-containing protein/tetratricopeptide (TPR) repeat protein
MSMRPEEIEPVAGSGRDPGLASPPERRARPLYEEEGRPRGDFAQLVARMAERAPWLPELLDAHDRIAREQVLARIPGEQREGAILMLVVVCYNLQEKERRPRHALAVADAVLWLARHLPADLTPGDGSKLGRTRHVADALVSLGGVYADLGEPQRALDHYLDAEAEYARDAEERRALHVPEESEFDRQFHPVDVRASLFQRMSRLYQALGDVERAGAYARRAEERLRQNPSRAAEFEAALHNGLAAEHAGEYEPALHWYWEALRVATADPASLVTPMRVVTAHHHLGSALAALGLHRGALRHHRRALELNERTGVLERIGRDHRAIGEVLERRPDLGDALEHYLLSLDAASADAVDTAELTWTRPDGARRAVIAADVAQPAALACGRVLAARGDDERAGRFLALAVEVGEVQRARLVDDAYRIGFQESHIDAYREMVALQARRYAAAIDEASRRALATSAWRYAERARGRAFLDALGATRLAPPASVAPELVARESALLDARDRTMQGSAARDAGARRAGWAEYHEAQRALVALWQEMRAHHPEAEAYVGVRLGAPTEAAELPAILRGGAGRAGVLVSYFLLDDRVVVFGMRDGMSAPELVVVPVAVAELARFVAANFGRRDGVRALAGQGKAEGWHELLDPLAAPIARWAERDEPVCLVPHGVLHYVPMHALHVDGEPLVARNPVSVAPSASVLEYCRLALAGRRALPAERSAPVLVVGDPRGDLPNARVEAAALARLLGVAPLLDGAATLGAVRARLADAALVHFAGHAYFASDRPMDSGLWLADGEVLTAETLLGERLRASLVTLSACETGVSEQRPGDELLGLTRALLHAGVPRVVVSLWQVADESTAFLMERFYGALRDDPDAGAAEALRRAMLATRAEPRWGSMFHWAPFTLVGDWS